jgi:LL-diaminopimelate aminotransferase
MITSYDTRRKIVGKFLKKLGLTFTLPQASFYIWAKIPDKERDSYTYAMKLLHEKQILLTPGTAFGKNGDRYVRVCVCVNTDLIKEYEK